MITIIKRGTKHQTTCGSCGAVLTYEDEDILRTRTIVCMDIINDVKYIICPQCNQEIYLEKSK